ncbi:MAG: hypothetical protein SCAL_000689 [Candidatus Syntrophoarchaeum caldarius]|uniref:Uncharacterized protein n=1 Tax=Candidatus Syntropharchaeum caldarium TaxID=1838285 RepID=A0A1F2P9I5_9EURY|nr:MAG: hypothetical protein SCAL_000689 [Candidatus Syntrophoarchaeum caldarius]
MIVLLRYKSLGYWKNVCCVKKMSEETNKILEYHVPQLGKISARLYPLATETYNLLDNYDHIDRMREIDQLGVIRSVYEGAHHSRWEYVMLQLELIYKLRSEKSVKGLFGLNSNINILGKEISGAEILQIWILLFNAGHLPGTFATERALLRYCQKHSDLRAIITKGLPARKQREYFKEILENEDIYNFHKILIYFHLGRYRRYSSKIPNFVDFLQEVLNFYIIDSEEHEEKQRNLKNLFHRIRQVSYLFLDSQYGPVPIDFNLSTIFLNFPDHIVPLFKEYDTPIIRTLDSLEDLLSINMYHSDKSMRELGFHTKRIEQLIGKEKKDKELTKITGLQRYLMKDYNDFQPQSKDWKKAFNIHVLFEILPFPLLTNAFKKNLSYEIEEKWNKKYGTTSCQLALQAAPTSKHIAITLSFYPQSQIQKNVEILGYFLKDLINLNDKIKNEVHDVPETEVFIDYVFQKPYQELLLSILGYITEEELSFELKDENLFAIFMLAVKGSKNAAKIIKKICKDLNSFNSRSHELKTLQDSLGNLSHRSELLLSLSSILVYDDKRNHLTDIDGFGLGFKNGSLGVLLVEAKDQRQRAHSDSERQLKETLKKLNFKTSESPDIVQVEKGAYCYLTIDGSSREGDDESQ